MSESVRDHAERELDRRKRLFMVGYADGYRDATGEKPTPEQAAVAWEIRRQSLNLPWDKPDADG